MSSLRSGDDTPGREANYLHGCPVHGAGRGSECAACEALTREAIAAALSATSSLVGGAVAAGDQRVWLRAVQAHPDLGALRADGWRNVCAVARVLMWRARRSEMAGRVWTSIPTRALIMRRTGLKESAVKKWLRWLRESGFLGTVTAGSTPRFRPGTRGGLDDDGAANLGAEYVLMIPASLQPSPRPSPPPPAAGALEVAPAAGDVPEAAQPPSPSPARPTGTTLRPSRNQVVPAAGASDSGDGKRPPSLVLLERTNEDPHPRNAGARRARARHDHLAVGKDRAVAGGAEGRPGAGGTAWTWSLAATPGTKMDMLRAAQALRFHSVILRRLSARHLRSILRPFFAAGWTADDVLHGLDHRPNGSAWTLTSDPSYVPGWIRYRLAPWTSAGLPARSPSQARAERRAAATAAALEARQRRAAAVATRAADPAAAAAAARAHLAASSPSALAAMQRRQARKARQVRRTAAAAAIAQQGDHGLLPSATEPEEVFQREVLDRHALPHIFRTSPRESRLPLDAPVAVAVQRAWLVQMTAGRRQDGSRTR
ncbi:hypothetical protein [Streptosporangium sp. NPDC023615]|uniref:hypothetical protein n=1 Tax=Streptosporangium sp. NPDC023615 TaxID=3154794 RepID=UPI00341F4B72